MTNHLKMWEIEFLFKWHWTFLCDFRSFNEIRLFQERRIARNCSQSKTRFLCVSASGREFPPKKIVFIRAWITKILNKKEIKLQRTMNTFRHRSFVLTIEERIYLLSIRKSNAQQQSPQRIESIQFIDVNQKHKKRPLQCTRSIRIFVINFYFSFIYPKHWLFILNSVCWYCTNVMFIFGFELVAYVILEKSGCVYSSISMCECSALCVAYSWVNKTFLIDVDAITGNV